MKRRAALLFLVTLTLGFAALDAEADRWWAHVRFLADDALEGRETGSAGYRKAAAYVTAEFQKAGLQPGGTDGYLQPIGFKSRRILEDKSSLALVRGGKAEPIALGAEATISMRVDPAPQLEAPIVFAGHGLRIPEAKYDDLAGLDLRGKVVLFLSGGPSRIPGPLLSHYQSVRWSYLKETGAVGTMSITDPRNMEIPWERSILSRFQPSLTLADPALDETAGQKLAVTINPARAEKFFAGTGHTFKDILARAEAGKPLPTFELPASLRATVAVASEDVESPNVVGLLPGTDPVLKDEYVVLSAHLDHVGIGEPLAPLGRAGERRPHPQRRDGQRLGNRRPDRNGGRHSRRGDPVAKVVGVRRRDGRGKGAAGLALLRQPSDGASRSHRGERQHRHVPADHPDAKRHGVGVRGVGPRRRRAEGGQGARHRGAARPRAGAEHLHEERSVQLHQARSSGHLPEDSASARIRPSTRS